MNILKKEKKSDRLYEEVFLAPSIIGKRRDFLYEYLNSIGLTSLSEVTTETLVTVCRYLRQHFAFNPKMYTAYKGIMDTVMFSYLKHIDHPFSRLHPWCEEELGRKCLVYLYACGISDIKSVTAEVRRSYDEYLDICVPKKRKWALRFLDNMVRAEIAKIRFVRTPEYKDELIYIGYYPDIRVARKTTYILNTKYLYFDFSVKAPSLMKRQIFQTLIGDLTAPMNHSDSYFADHFIIPLHHLYDFCIKYGISDLKQLTDKEANDFKEYLNKNCDAVYKDTMQVLFRTRRFLFLNDKKPDFTATCWFLERFMLEDRQNPSSGIFTFYFGDISAENRIYIQQYMKYLLVLSPKYSVQSLKTRYLQAKDFTLFLERGHISLTDISYSDIEDYLKYQDSMGNKPHTFNVMIDTLESFLTELSVRQKIPIPSFPYEYYRKKHIYMHHDRSVPDDIIDRIFSVLPRFPETLGLMYLTLYSTGLRISEVCSLKKDALIAGNDTYWVKVYQTKLRMEKEIPIPEELYSLLTRHIANDTTRSEYIFPKNTDPHKPYASRYFGEQVQKQLLLYEETRDIHFKSHDYRHTIATDLHMSGVPLAAARAFLGHKKEDMTKQYIDHMQGQIDKLQDEYLKENELK